MQREMAKVKDLEIAQTQELRLKHEVLELNVKHLNERISLNEEDIKQKEATIADLSKET